MIAPPLSSDIDILIDYNLVGISLAEQYRITPWFPAGLKLDLEALLDRPVDIATPTMLKDRNRDRILSEAIQHYDGIGLITRQFDK